MNVEIAIAQAEDAREIARVHVASWQAAYEGIIPAAILDNLDESERAQRWAADAREPHRMILLASVSGTPCGFCSFEPARAGDLVATCGEITAIYVVESHWGLGAGPALLQRALESLSRKQFESVCIWVLEANARARWWWWGPQLLSLGAATYGLASAFRELSARTVA